VTQRQIAILTEQLRQSGSPSSRRRPTPGKVNEAEGRLAAAEAQLTQAEAAHAQARWDRRHPRSSPAPAHRRAELRRAGTMRQGAGGSRATPGRGGARLITAAQANLINPAMRSAQVAAVQGQIAQVRADIVAVQADAERARAQLDEARANRKDLNVIAPFTGTVATRTAEPGEVVTAGTPIITLIDLGRVYLRGFVPEGQIGRVRVGQPARVYLDSAPTTPIDAVVMRIDPQAMFTPENTYFREERVKQVVGLKLLLRGAVGFAKPGMPADGEILVDGSQWPARRTR
jgi:HlyD family secretion protein